MSNSRRQFEKRPFFSRTIVGRLLAGLLSIALLPLAVVFLLALTVGPAGNNWLWWIARIALWDLCAALTIVCVCGVIWSLFMPAWLPTFVERYARRLSLLLLAPFIVLAVLLIV